MRLTFGPSFPGKRPIDLSTLTKLKDIVISYGWSFEWITGTLNTITSEHLRQITLCPREGIGAMPFEGTRVRNQLRGSWSGLERVLLKFSESHSVHSKIHYDPLVFQKVDFFERLLPESSRRGVVELVLW